MGLVSQLWLRKYHPGWYKKYNYILGGALDGGAQVMIFVLSFAVFGASGVERPFPSVKHILLCLDQQLTSFIIFFSGPATQVLGMSIIVMVMGLWIDSYWVLWGHGFIFIFIFNSLSILVSCRYLSKYVGHGLCNRLEVVKWNFQNCNTMYRASSVNVNLLRTCCCPLTFQQQSARTLMHVYYWGVSLVQFAQEEDISLEGSFSDQLRRVSNILPRGPRPYWLHLHYVMGGMICTEYRSCDMIQ